MAKQADLIKRIVAAVVDMVVLGVVFFAISVVSGLNVAAAQMMADPVQMAMMMASMAVLWIVSALIGLAYFVYFEGTTGQTPGKKLVNIKVVTEKGGRQPEYADVLVRNILRIIDFLPVFYILGFILIAASESKQRLGDMAAKTIVVEA